jgi:hypothetical protein
MVEAAGDSVDQTLASFLVGAVDAAPLGASTEGLDPECADIGVFREAKCLAPGAWRIALA